MLFTGTALAVVIALYLGLGALVYVVAWCTTDGEAIWKFIWANTAVVLYNLVVFFIALLVRYTQ